MLFIVATNLSYTDSLTTFFTTSLTLLKSTGTGMNLSISNLSTSAFKLAKSHFAANLDVQMYQFLLHYLFLLLNQINEL